MYWQQRMHPVGKGFRPWIFHQLYPHAWSRVEFSRDVQPAMKRSSKPEGKKKKAEKLQLFVVVSFFWGFKQSCRESWVVGLGWQLLTSFWWGKGPLHHEYSGIFWQNYHRRLGKFSLNHRIYLSKVWIKHSTLEKDFNETPQQGKVTTTRSSKTRSSKTL